MPFPLSVAHWHGERSALAQAYLSQLLFDANYSLVLYAPPDGGLDDFAAIDLPSAARALSLECRGFDLSRDLSLGGVVPDRSLVGAVLRTVIGGLLAAASARGLADSVQRGLVTCAERLAQDEAGWQAVVPSVVTAAAAMRGKGEVALLLVLHGAESIARTEARIRDWGVLMQVLGQLRDVLRVVVTASTRSSLVLLGDAVASAGAASRSGSGSGSGAAKTALALDRVRVLPPVGAEGLDQLLASYAKATGRSISRAAIERAWQALDQRAVWLRAVLMDMAASGSSDLDAAVDTHVRAQQGNGGIGNGGSGANGSVVDRVQVLWPTLTRLEQAVLLRIREGVDLFGAQALVELTRVSGAEGLLTGSFVQRAARSLQRLGLAFQSARGRFELEQVPPSSAGANERDGVAAASSEDAANPRDAGTSRAVAASVKAAKRPAASGRKPGKAITCKVR